MTCIAWDGKTLAADKKGTYGNTITRVTKIWKHDGLLMAGAGDAATNAAMREWVKAGRDPAQLPEIQKTGEFSPFMVIETDGRAVVYEKGAVPVHREDRFVAIGSGRDFALAAMHLGKNARQAVELACQLDAHCGQGIDTLEA